MAEEAPQEQECPGPSTKLFRIPEPDLVEMERIVPLLCMRFMEHLDPKSRTQFGRLKQILSDVRWEHGPPRNVERIDC